MMHKSVHIGSTAEVPARLFAAALPQVPDRRGIADFRRGLGNRTALEWILDQYKEKTPKGPTIREKFNTYRFADHKEKVIDLLKRVTRVSVETMKIVEAMRAEKR
jgi:predicted helicase